MPKISIITPVYNSEKYLKECIESVINQTYGNWELILVDDIGNDDSMNIANEYVRNNSRIKIIHHAKNMGPMEARRTGYQNATGRYYMFVDSDDTLPTDSLESLYRAMKESECDIVIGGYTVIWPDGKKIIKIPSYSEFISPHDAFVHLLKGEITHNLAFCIYSSSLFRNDFITYPNQTNGEDLMLFYQLVNFSTKIGFCNKSIYNYYQNTTSSSHAKLTKDRLMQFVNVHNFKYTFLRTKGISERHILGNIIPKVSDWYRVNDAYNVIKHLHKDIQKALKQPTVFKYLSFKETVIYLLSYIKFKAIKQF